MFRPIITALLLSAGACPAFAQSQEPAQEPAKHLARLLLVNFDRIDANADGIISRAEYQNVQIVRWPQIDLNGDGFLGEDDFPRFAAHRVRTQLAKITYLDADSDGRISQGEFLNGPPLLFQRADRNGDDALTRSELEAARNQD